MYSETNVRTAFDSMISAIEPLPFSMAGISRKLASPAPKAAPRFVRPALAAAAALAIAASLPAVAPSFVQDVEGRIERILQWTPPQVPAPKWLTSQLRATDVTLAQARARVPFTLVQPSGLPGDASLASIAIAPAGVYTKATQSWSLGTPFVIFTYSRGHGRSFTLLADVYDPQMGPPGKYTYMDAGTGADGQEKLVRYPHFEWRNGNQVISATASDAVSAQEIENVRASMGGTPVAPAESRAQRDSGSIVKLYLLGS